MSLPIALGLVRAMLRGQGAWCRLEVGDRFTVHVGWDLYVYVGTDGPCADAVARTRELGLFPEPLTASPYDVGAVLAALPAEYSVEVVWEAQDGAIHRAGVDDTEHQELTALVADARAACALSMYTDERHPLFVAALPDRDGVLRARW
ncbi:hypothetical protein [Streptomyces erythrochromogenes]|uniref:hypothetical protein n=1 Tax=Streptomyces erythrochromogenes TaxID=285574 RepID=UPI0037D2106D